MKPAQLELFEELERQEEVIVLQEKAKEPYFNARGEPLPWEEEAAKTLISEKINKNGALF